MKYFVIGGAGFIGSHVVDRLMRDRHTVTVFDNLSTGKKTFLKPYLKNPRFKFCQADILNLSQLKKTIPGHDFVFHFAANSDIMRAMANPSLDFEQGVRATFHVLEAMRVNGLKKLLYLSGSGIYGDFGEIHVAENVGPLNPKSMYGAAKLASEGMISAYNHLYGLKAWILRPANIIGARPTHGVIYDFIQMLKKNPRKLEVRGDGTQSKSYLHISDLIDAIFFVLEHAKETINQFNVATESYMDVRTIACRVVKQMGLRDVAVCFGKENRGWKGDVPKYRLSIEKIKSLGWRPKLNSEEAVNRTIQEILSV